MNNDFLQNHKEKLVYHVIENKGITSKGRVATSGADTSDVKGAPVGTNMVLTCTKYSVS
jgi:hypothetical protein